jgi:hypothetical protein
VGFTGRYILRAVPNISQKMSEAAKFIPKLDAQVQYFFIIFLLYPKKKKKKLYFSHTHTLTCSISEQIVITETDHLFFIYSQQKLYIFYCNNPSFFVSFFFFIIINVI